ncbi:hypothetical protein [uncultured Desulfosarcina sp.]|uniref:hypothetical protein n=1 Tax=uncultured Desulfosarcina sp. TaxID=218289 RepID=UPI0029C67E88|nr:hypothetical protein [uncultured Desulfosarcina sp.]
MTFADASRMAISKVYKLTGSPAVFSPSMGDDVACTVIVDTNSDWQPGGTIQVAEQQTIVSYQRAHIDRKVRRGETFAVGSTVYTVVSMAHYPGSWTEFEGKAVVVEA